MSRLNEGTSNNSSRSSNENVSSSQPRQNVQEESASQKDHDTTKEYDDTATSRRSSRRGPSKSEITSSNPDQQQLSSDFITTMNSPLSSSSSAFGNRRRHPQHGDSGFFNAIIRSWRSAMANHNNYIGGRSWTAFVVVLLRLTVVRPIRAVYNFIFPFSETDEMSPAVTAKAAAQFVTYLKTLQLQTQSSSFIIASSSSFSHHHQSTNVTGSSTTTTSNNNNNNNNNSSSSNTNDSTTNVTAQNTDSNSNILSRISDAWYTSGFESAKQDAIASRRLLLVYLHSPLHRLSDYVATSFLNTTAFLDFVCPPSVNGSGRQPQPQVVAIGVSIHTTQGAQLASALQITAYPALVLLQPPENPSTSATPSSSNSAVNSSASTNRSPRNSTPMQLMLRAESAFHLTAPKLLPFMIASLTRYQVIVAEREMRRIQREQEIALRKQQDEEYQATLLADQERELRIQNEVALKQQQIQAKIDAEQQRLNEYARKKERIRVEPPPTHPKSDVTVIRFVLPNGTKLNRRFYNDDTIEVLRNYIEVYYHETPTLSDIGTVGLSTNVLPRTTFNGDEHTSLSLKDAKLHPAAVLMVQDLDL